METILLVINIILAVILVLLVLIQKSEGGALGIGVSQENFMLSRSAGSFMTKATAIVRAKLQIINNVATIAVAFVIKLPADLESMKFSCETPIPNAPPSDF